jgi:hypothetical protein
MRVMWKSAYLDEIDNLHRYLSGGLQTWDVDPTASKGGYNLKNCPRVVQRLGLTIFLGCAGVVRYYRRRIGVATNPRFPLHSGQQREKKRRSERVGCQNVV